MCEGQAFECHIADFALGVLAKDAKERVDTRSDGIGGCHVFAFAGLVIKRVGRFVQVPFTRLVDEFIGVFEVIDLLFRRVAHERGTEHRILAAEKLAPFRILGFEFQHIALTRNLVQAQNAFGPGNHQMDFDLLGVLPFGRFDIAAVQEERTASGIYFVQTEEVVVAIALEVRHTGTNRLLVVHVKLAETRIDTFDLPDVVLFVMDGPAGHRDTARNKRSFAVCGFITHIVTVFTAIGLSKVDRCRELVGSITENHFDIARHGAINRTHSLLGLRNRLEGSLLGSLIGIASIGSDIERSLDGSTSSSCTKKES